MNRIIWGIVTIILLVIIFLFVPAVNGFLTAIYTAIIDLNDNFFNKMPAWFGYSVFAVFLSAILSFVWNFKK